MKRGILMLSLLIALINSQTTQSDKCTDVSTTSFDG
jgi:hypothetical protein